MKRRAFLAACATAITSAPAIAFAEETQVMDPDGALNALGSNPSYNEFVDYAEKYLSDMDDPQHMSLGANSEPSTYAGSNPYWSSSNKGAKTFYDGNGNIWLSSAHKIVDVSSWQEDINWDATSQAVDGAVLRIGYGVGNTDRKYERNLSECRRLGVPYGVYFYSYAYDASFARREAQWLSTLFSRYSIDRNTPVFYDLEQFEPWSGHYPPTSVSAYEGIVDGFFSVLSANGFSSLHVYSYRSYLTTGPLASAKIRSRASWVAEYNPTLKYSISATSGVKGWQYTSTGSVSGISGHADISAFNLSIHWTGGGYPYGFPDVYSWTPHAEDILWLKENGIAHGYGNGYFGTYDEVQREQMAAFMYRIVGSPSYSPTSEDMARFPDVTSSTSHAKEIWWLGSTEIAEGYGNGYYGPYDPITREQMAAFLYRLAGFPDYEPSTEDMARFPDVDEATPHAKEIWWMGAQGLSTGYKDEGGIYGPFRNILRLDMAAFLHRWHDVFGV